MSELTHVSNNQCLAWGYQTCGTNNCYLKGSIPALTAVPSGCVISGVITAQRSIDSSMGMYGPIENGDRNGGELPNMPMLGLSLQDCQSQCYS